jgi:hypothetical protein
MLGVDLEKLDAEQQKSSGKAKSIVVLSRRILKMRRSPRAARERWYRQKLSMH